MPVENLNRNDALKSRGLKSPSGLPAIVEPVVFSFSRSYMGAVDGLSAGDAAKSLSSILTEVAASIREADGFIGHVKALLTVPEGGVLSISVVRDRADWKEHAFDCQSPISIFKIAVTAIVYGFSRDELKRLLLLGLALGLPQNLYREAPGTHQAAPLLSIDSILAARL